MKYLFDNWKMYLEPKEAVELAEKFSKLDLPKNIESAVFPNPISFLKIEKKLKDSDFSLGGQNVAWTPKGAYTGAVSAYIYSQSGADYALVGHSERRHIFNESNKATKKKVEACLAEDINPILCIGETKEQLESGNRELVLGEQLEVVLSQIDIDSNNELIIGYEPVWAIAGSGDGEICSPEDVTDIHHWIKQKTKKFSDHELDVVYGGSVEANNVQSYISLKEVDGILLGHASADYEQFKTIIDKVEGYV